MPTKDLIGFHVEEASQGTTSLARIRAAFPKPRGLETYVNNLKDEDLLTPEGYLASTFLPYQRCMAMFQFFRRVIDQVRADKGEDVHLEDIAPRAIIQSLRDRGCSKGTIEQHQNEFPLLSCRLAEAGFALPHIRNLLQSNREEAFRLLLEMGEQDDFREAVLQRSSLRGAMVEYLGDRIHSKCLQLVKAKNLGLRLSEEE